MSPINDLQLVELVAARICHDLVGPVGAIANGMELLGDGTQRPDPDVIRLIQSSAHVASRRLQIYRVAFGTGNALPATGRLAEGRKLAAGAFEVGRTSLDWPAPDAPVEAASGRIAVKLLLGLILIALEALHRGGSVQVRVSAPGDRLAASVKAVGPQVRLADDMRAVLGGDFASLGPKSVGAYLLHRQSTDLGGRLTVSEAANELELVLDFPAGA